MTKIYLHKNLTIVLTVISSLLSATYFLYTYTLYGISLVNVEALQDPGFQYKFLETIIYAIIFLALTVYFAIKVLLNKPIVEISYDDDFVYEELEESTNDNENNIDEMLNSDESDNDNK